MAQPVVHFEITGRDPERLRAFFAQMFGWEYELSPTAPSVSDPGQYGFVDRITAPDGTGIRGGVGGGPAHAPRALFYIQVDDVAATLERAVALGATRLMGPETAPNGLVVAQFGDPEGNLIGLAGG